ncbi:unnamed protein product [Aspergillus oryzae]|uniref:Unnamed protein product n=2 Tax=Aspergillus oryzae TaxID=5062 RepID=A0AAN4Y7U8_ASPOZ|nr:unnamed protein product [Aspergillus oryzae]GMF88031.1 unnamed protein product [Aspergillus oryzae]GMG06535.1 unnamed protein product [Aspergillus oryzae]GMG24376.1 unnamed protein product [Aspergillus oryzae]GMG47649.1 unnamed protein product [Aspergillus oryzae var. brunneus]
MPIATDTRAEPNTFPTTVGMVEKKPPLPIPLIITKTINGPMDVETGQRISMLRALSKRDMNRVFSGPSLSLQKPHISLPTAEEKLNAATTPAPTPEFIPIDSQSKSNVAEESPARELEPESCVRHVPKGWRWDVPLHKLRTLDWHPFFNEARCWQARPPDHETNDPEGPRDSHLTKQGVHDKTNDGTPEATSGVNHPVSNAALCPEILRRDRRDHHKTNAYHGLAL